MILPILTHIFPADPLLVPGSATGTGGFASHIARHNAPYRASSSGPGLRAR